MAEPYQEPQEYRAELMSAVRDILGQYEEFISGSLFSHTIYEGMDAGLQRKERVLLLEESCPEELAEDYEKKQSRIRDRLLHSAERAAASIQKGTLIPLEYLYRIFRAEEFLRHCVMLALAPEWDAAFERLYERYPENGRKTRPTLDFCLRTYTMRQREREALMEERAAQSDSFCFFFGPEGGSGTLTGEMRLDRRVLLFLLQPQEIDPVIRPFCRPALTHELEDKPMVIREALAERMVQYMTEPERGKRIYFIHGAAGAGKRFLVRHVYRQLNRICLMTDGEGLKGEDGPDRLDRVIREARLRRAGLCIWNAEKIWETGEFRWRSFVSSILEKLPDVFILAGTKWPYEKEDVPGRMLELELTEPDMGERIRLWQEALRRSAGVDTGTDLEALSAKFSFLPGQIMGSVKEAVQTAAWKEEPLTEELLYQACRRQVSHHLGEKATQIRASYGWEDLILPEKSKKILKNACDQIEYHHMVYEKWGFQKKIAYGRGVSMLFYGPPGTGKTMGAQVIAGNLHLELYKVDLSSVMSKYIGETEKNLGEIFREVKKSQSILFFDEADALFGKRAEVKEAQDKYANAETAYLLQKMEEYEGIVILATNYLQNFDEAFKRRIKFMIEFPFPDRERRLQIWKNAYPEETPLGEDIDYDYLASQFEISGSSIRNIAVAAAFLAASEQTEVHMEHILFSLWEEIRKSGKLLQKEDFGEYYGLLNREE